MKTAINCQTQKILVGVVGRAVPILAGLSDKFPCRVAYATRPTSTLIQQVFVLTGVRTLHRLPYISPSIARIS